MKDPLDWSHRWLIRVGACLFVGGFFLAIMVIAYAVWRYAL